MDETKVKDLIQVYQREVAELDTLQIQGRLENMNSQYEADLLPAMAFGLIDELKQAVSKWPVKRELIFEGKTYRTYTTALVDLEGDQKLIFTEAQLTFNKPDDVYPMAVGLTDTEPDENGTLRERHFSAKYYSDNASEIQFVEFPYRQKSAGKPIINTKAIVVVARRMIQQLPHTEQQV